MAAPTNAANVKKALANPEPSTHGPSLHFAATQQLGRIRSEADIDRFSVRTEAVAFDPLADILHPLRCFPNLGR